jgi:gliding motility-associated-like protein
MVTRLLFLCLAFLPVSLGAQIACPAVNAGPDRAICPGQCANLTATFVATGQTSTYTVAPTPYTPYPFAQGTPVLVNSDDIWTGAINLPFTFCFYGNAYNQCVIGANGLISFNVAQYANAYCQWPINAGFPSANNPLNVITCPFHDIDPSIYGDTYVATYGVAPCRVFVVSWNNVAMFDCNNISSTQQIAIFETTNIIETYIQSKTLCTSWNGGAAIHGIQNANGTQATVVPGRNFPSQWTANNDAWRFTPAGPSNVTVTWLQNGAPIANGTTVSVCPPSTSTYTAQAVYTNCNGTQVTVNDQATVTVINTSLAPTNTGSYCPGQTIQLNAGAANNTGTFVWTGPNGQVVGNTRNLSLPNAQLPNAGTYTVSWTTTTGCTATATTNVVVNSNTATITGVPAICAGQNAVLTANQGGSSYLWSNGGTTQTINVATAGNYAVTVTYPGGCTATATQSVTVSPVPTPAIAGQFTICPGDSTAFTASGGVSYAWSNGQTTPSITVNAVGVYTVTATNAAGCTASTSATLLFNPAITANIAATTNFNGFNISCFGLCNGGATASGAGGNGNYQYAWADGQTTPALTGLCAGTYTVTVTDGIGCSGSASIVLTQPAVLSPTTQVSDATCFGTCNGTANIVVTGGAGVINYSWSNGATGTSAVALCAGGYTVTATDGNGCTTTASVSIAQDPDLTVAPGQIVDASCFGACDGTIAISAAGGFPPYTYAWNNGDTNEDPDSLCAGVYGVTVVDAHGCSELLNGLNVAQPQPLNGIVSGFANVTCFGAANGTANLSVLGGTQPYSFAWSNAATTEDLSNLPPGSFAVTVTDANACTATATVSISEPPLLTVSASATPATCGGSCDGTLNAVVAGGVAPYSIAWNGGVAPILSPTGVCAGNYVVTVTDANGCTATAAATVTEPTALSASITTVTPVTCNGFCNGAIDLTVSGGTPGYAYAWTGGLPAIKNPTGVCAGTYTVTITDGNGCTAVLTPIVPEPLPLNLVLAQATDLLCNNQCDGALDITASGGTPVYAFVWSGGQATEDLTGLCAGNYSVTATDANGCTFALANLQINQPAVLTASLVGTTPATCNAACNGTIDLIVAGGVLPYSYAWSGGLASVQDPTGVCAGTYAVTVTDANGCSVTVGNITITEPTALQLTNTVTAVTCNGFCNGAIDVSASGGIPPYAYQWSNGSATEDLSQICSGQYSVTLTDANGCTLGLSNLDVTQPPVLTVQVDNVQAVTCNGLCDGSIQISVGGGTAPYTYLWSNGSTTEDISGLCFGQYSAVVTDANGCTVNLPAVNMPQPAPLAVTLGGLTNVDCFGACNGALNLNVFGGTAPYNFNWSFPFGNIEDPVNICPGTYAVTATDANGCTAALANLTITEPPLLTVAVLSTSDLTCSYNCNGAISIAVNGGVPAYNIAWNNNLSGTTINNLCAGGYSVTVTDINNCTVSTSAFINTPPALTATTTVQAVSCFGGSDGAVDLLPTGGTPGYQFNWSNGATSEDIAGLTLGVYQITVTDANACTFSTSAIVPEPTDLTLSITVQNAICYTSATGSIDLVPVGGTPAYTFSWSNGAVTEDITVLTAGPYAVTVTDANGCTETISGTVAEPPPFLIAQTGMTPTDCWYSCDGNASVLATGGTPFPFGYEYVWNDGQTSPSALNLCAGPYSVTASDENGCTATFSVTVTSPTAISPSVTTTPLSCFNGSDGTATASASGGTPGYNYLWNTGNVGPFQVNLPRGNVFVTVSDANGCTISTSSFVSSPNPLSGNPSSIDAACADLANGAIALNPTGGTAPYFYQWSDGQTNAVAIGIGAGSPMNVTLTDGNGCDTTFFALEVGEPLPLQMIASVLNDPFCTGAASGSATATVFGGTPVYTFEWDLNTAGQTVNTLTAGLHTVTVTDANGCTTVDTVALIDPLPVVGEFTAIGVVCFGQENGAIYVDTISGGTSPYEVSINGTDYFPNINTGYRFDGLVAGPYEAYVTDLYGCADTVQLEIVQPAEVQMFVGLDTTIQLGDSVLIMATIASAPEGYTLAWTPATALSCDSCLQTWAMPFVTTQYTLTWSDSNGCTGFDRITVEVTPERRVFIPNAFSPNDDGLNDVFMVYGGTGVYRINDFQIFDRWGELLFSRTDFFPNDPLNGWDGMFKGKMMNPGAYVYFVEVEFVDGRVLMYKGDINLIR